MAENSMENKTIFVNEQAHTKFNSTAALWRTMVKLIWRDINKWFRKVDRKKKIQRAGENNFRKNKELPLHIGNMLKTERNLVKV